MKKIIEDLNWRYATKKFDPNLKIPEETISTILEALRLVPSSLGFQPNKIFLIEDQDVRKQLVEAANGQQQVAEASHLLVLTSYREMKYELIESFLDEVARIRNQDRSTLTGFENMLVNFSRSRSPEELSTWMAKQNYILIGHLMQICAQLRIDSTPMEGFNPKAVDEILGLEPRNLKSDLLIPLGYRHMEDVYLSRKKVRRPSNEVIEII